MNILKLFSQPEIDNAVRIKSQTAFTGSYIDTIFDIIFHQDRGRFIVPSNLILAAMEVEELRARAEIAEHIQQAGLTDFEVAGLRAENAKYLEIISKLLSIIDDHGTRVQHAHASILLAARKALAGTK